MELKLRNGAYVPDGAGGFACAEGDAALLERVLFRLTARRGNFPLLPEMGSRLYELPRLPAAVRRSAAEQAAAEALAEENLTVEGVTLTETADGLSVAVRLTAPSGALTAALTVS